MGYYAKHVFVCLNRREGGKRCCAGGGSEPLFDYMKKRIKALGLDPTIRINRAGCLGRCDEGPMLVIYPEGRWFHYTNTADIDDIIEKHLLPV